jgi:hypothetical protein
MRPVIPVRLGSVAHPSILTRHHRPRLRRFEKLAAVLMLSDGTVRHQPTSVTPLQTSDGSKCQVLGCSPGPVQG